MKQRNVAILIHDGVEVLDFCGPFEVFGVADHQAEPLPFNVFTVAESTAMVRTNTGLLVVPNYSFAECPPLDILLVPGGNGAGLIKDEAIITWVGERAETTDYMLSVCTGALLYGKLGLLDNLDSTTHYSALEALAKIAPHTTVKPDARYVDNGQVITSAGISAGIDMALYVVGRLLGKQVAVETARYVTTLPLKKGSFSGYARPNGPR